MERKGSSGKFASMRPAASKKSADPSDGTEKYRAAKMAKMAKKKRKKKS